MNVITEIKNIKLQLANVFSTLNKITGDNSEKIAVTANKADALDAKTEEIVSTVDTNEEALDFIAEEVLPAQEEKTSEIEDSVDYILTEIIPSLMDGE